MSPCSFSVFFSFFTLQCIHDPSHLSSDFFSKSTSSPIFTIRLKSSHYSTIIFNRLSPWLWLALHPSSSWMCVCVCVCETPHHQPIIRISADDPAEAWGKKSKPLFLGSLFLFLSPPQWTKPVADAFTLWAKRANSSIYIYVCKTPSTLPLKQCKWNWVALLICLLFFIPETLR